MVVVRIELWPQGNEQKARCLGEVRIFNDGTGTAGAGNYGVEVDHGGTFYGKPGLWRKGRVRGYRRNLSPYHLVAMALAAAGIR